MLLKRIWRVVREAAAICSRRHRCGRLQMMLEKPDLIDADALGQLDLFELAPEHLRMRRIFARGRGRPDGESHRLIHPGFKRQHTRPAASRSWARRVPSITLPARPFRRSVSASMKGENTAPVEGNLTCDPVYWEM